MPSGVECGTSFPTGATIADLNPRPVGTDLSTVVCESGRRYTVQAGDTCKSIALSQSVSQGALWTINNLLPDCSRMSAGDDLCLPRSCAVVDMSLEANATCFITAISFNATYAAFLSWNPSINSGCTNLSPDDTVVCVSSPYETWNATVLPGVSPTKTAGWASSTAPAPAPTAFRTTPFCGLWYVCQPGDDCARVSIQYNLSPQLFKALNPSIDTDCTNLLPDLAYCVQPSLEWDSDYNAPPNRTVIPPPAPTTPGTTDQCFQWHVPRSNETCSLIAASYGIEFSTLRFWNPDLDADCFNFLTGVAYCVGGLNLPPDTATTPFPTTSLPTPTSTSRTTTTTTGSRTCGRTYTVVMGDFCFKIYSDAGLTEAQFRALNPSLNANCDLDIGQVVCVAPPGATSITTTTTTTSRSRTTSVTTSVAPACKKNYTVVGGDFCFKIWTDNGLTEARFRQLNPQLNANCDLNIGQVLCVG